MARGGDATPSGDPASYRLLFDEAVRSLSAQEASLDEIRGRSGMMLSGVGVVSAFLGSAALGAVSSGRTADARETVLAILLTALSSVIFASLLIPRKWTFRVSAEVLLTDYIECDQPASLVEIHRSLAYYFWKAEEGNAKKLDGMFWWFTAASLVFVADVALWLLILYQRMMP